MSDTVQVISVVFYDTERGRESAMNSLSDMWRLRHGEAQPVLVTEREAPDILHNKGTMKRVDWA